MTLLCTVTTYANEKKNSVKCQPKLQTYWCYTKIAFTACYRIHMPNMQLHLFANLLPNWTLIPILTLLPNFGGFRRTLQRVRLANRGRLLLRTPGPVPFGTCICSNVETILSWTCHDYRPFEFRTSLGTSILLLSNCIKSRMRASGLHTLKGTLYRLVPCIENNYS